MTEGHLQSYLGSYLGEHTQCWDRRRAARKLRRADASELFLTGERFSADRAAEVGLINRSVPAPDLDTAVDAYVDALLAGGPNALAAAKRPAPA